MAVKFQQLSTWKAGGSLINERHPSTVDNGMYSRHGAAGNKDAGIIIGGAISPGAPHNGSVSSCTEEYNGSTDSWGSAANHLFTFKGSVAVGSQNAVLNAYINATPWNPSPSLTGGSSGLPSNITEYNVIDPHTSDEHVCTGGDSNFGSPSSFLSKQRISTTYDGTSWSTTARIMNGPPSFNFGYAADHGGNTSCHFGNGTGGGDLGAGAGTQNSAAYFGGEGSISGGWTCGYSLYHHTFDGTGWDGGAPPLVGRNGGSAIGSSMNNAKFLGGATHRPHCGVQIGYRGARLNTGNTYAPGSVYCYPNTGSNDYTEVCVPDGLCSCAGISGMGTHCQYVGTYSCVEDFDGTTWSTGTPLLLPRTLGAASGTSNDGILWGGAWLQGQSATGKNAAGNSTILRPRLNASTLCCILGADHWNGTTWTSDSANIISSYVSFGLAGNGDNSQNTINYCMPYHGGRVGVRGNGNSSNDLLSIDGVQTWFWEDAGTIYDNLCSGPYPSAGRVCHPNSSPYFSMYNDPPIVGGSGRTLHGGVCGHEYKGSLVREIATSKLSGVHFGPKLNKDGLSFYSDIGNCKNLFTNDYNNPIWGDSPELRQGKIAHNCIVSHGNYNKDHWQMRDGELSGWAVSPAKLSKTRDFQVSAGCTNSALVFGGTVPSSGLGSADGEVYNGTSWSVKNATLPVTICMGSSTGRNENDMLIAGVARACPISPAPATPFAPASSYKQTFKLEGDAWSLANASPIMMANCSNGMAGHGNSAIALGHSNACNETYWGSYDSAQTLIFDGTSWSSDQSKMPLAKHEQGALAGKVNSALLVGGCYSVLGCSNGYQSNLCTGVEAYDGTSWQFTALYPSSGDGVNLSSVGPNNQCVMSFPISSASTCKTTMFDGISFKECGPTIRWTNTNAPFRDGYIKRGHDEASTTSNSANSALAIASANFGQDSYDASDNGRDGVLEWINVNVRDAAGDFHFSEHSGSALQPTGSIDGKGQLLNHYGKIDPNYPDKNIYIAISSGSLQTDRYFSTTSTTVGSVWSTNSGLINTRCCFDMGGSMNSAMVVGGITGLSGAVGTAKTCTEQYNGITWEAGAAAGGLRSGPANAPTNCALGYLDGASRAGIWQHTITGCTADSITVHGGACPMASPGDNIESPAAGMAADALEWTGYNWLHRGASMLNPRVGMAGAGASQAAVLFGGGYHCARTLASMESLACTEEWNGKTYSAGGAMVETVCQGAGAGSQNSAVGFGGCCQVGSTYTGYSAISQEYDGTSWSNSAGLNNPRWGLAGSGTQNSAIAIGGSCRLNSDSTSLHQCVEEYDGTTWSNKTALPQTACEASVGNSSKSALAVGTSVFSNKYMDNTEVNRARKRVVTNASGGATISMWVRLPYADPVDASNEFNNKTYLFANADIDKNTSTTFNDRDGDTMRGRAGLRLLRHNGKLRLEWTNFLGSANEADTSFDASGNNLITSYWASDENQLTDTSLWYNIVAMTDFSRTAANNRMYVNGTLIANTAGVDNKTGGGLYDYESVIYPENDSARMTVGNWNGRNYSFDFAQVMFYDRLLSTVEVHQNFNSFRYRFI